MVTFTWKIESLSTNQEDDNFVFEAFVNVFGTSNGVTKKISVPCYFSGDKASIGADFKSIDDLKKADGEAIIVGWVKNVIGSQKIAEIEGELRKTINEHNNKLTEGWISGHDCEWGEMPTETPFPEGYPFMPQQP